MKNEKGITLIALIITIIVMLILVGVTINFALNGGIITKAKEAGTQTQIAADKEALQLSAIAAYDPTTNEVDFTELTNEALKLGFSGSNGVYTKNNITYSVDKLTAQVTEGNGGQESDSDSEQEPETVSIAGTYSNIISLFFDDSVYDDKPTQYILDTTEYDTIVINDDGTGTTNGTISFTWEMSQEDPTVLTATVSQYDMTITGKYATVGTNKVIVIYNEDTGYEVLTTNGIQGLTPNSNWTGRMYRNSPKRAEIGTDTIKGNTVGVVSLYSSDDDETAEILPYVYIENKAYIFPHEPSEVEAVIDEENNNLILQLPSGYPYETYSLQQ